MNTKMVAAFVIVISGLASVYSLSITTDHRRPLAAANPGTRASVDAGGDALAREIGRLQRLQTPGVAPARGRDVFRFATARVRVERVVPAARAPIEVPVAPPQPPLRLIGVAEDSASGQSVRTAIISAPDQLYVVKEGERVTSRFDVQRISPDVVELVDAVDASAVRLVLK
jgi:hypothetical protein